MTILDDAKEKITEYYEKTKGNFEEAKKKTEEVIDIVKEKSEELYKALSAINLTGSTPPKQQDTKSGTNKNKKVDENDKSKK